MPDPGPSSPSSFRSPARARASEDGRRGAAERERRWLERRLPVRSAAERRSRQIQQDRRRLQVAGRILTQVIGTPRRPRRKPPELLFLALGPEAVRAMIELADSPDERVQIRAAIWVLFAAGVSGDPWWGDPGLARRRGRRPSHPRA